MDDVQTTNLQLPNAILVARSDYLASDNNDESSTRRELQFLYRDVFQAPSKLVLAQHPFQGKWTARRVKRVKPPGRYQLLGTCLLRLCGTK